MNLNKILYVLLLTCLNVSLNAQPIPKRSIAQIGYFEAMTGSREILIQLDTLIINNVISTLTNEGCFNLDYFLRPFQNCQSFREYPVGFNFAKFNSGFGNTLKKEICISLALKEMCIDQIIENVFAPGKCYRDPTPFCYPVVSLIFDDKHPVVTSLIKRQIAINGYRIKYNPDNKVHNLFKKQINRAWIKLFSLEELALLDKDQVSYLRSLSTKNE